MRKQHFSAITAYIDEGSFFDNEQWNLVSIDKKHHIESYPAGDFDRAIFKITIKRKTEYFVLTAIIPCLLIGAIELVTFMIPFESSVRLKLSFTCMLAYSMFQTNITNQLPKSAEKPPLLLLLISLFTIHIGIAIFMQGLCIYLADLARKKDGSKPDKKLFRVFNVLGTCFCVKKKKKTKKVKSATVGPKIDSEVDDDDNEDADVDRNWLFIATVIDRISFIAFSVLLFGTTLIVLIIIPAVNNWGM